MNATVIYLSLILLISIGTNKASTEKTSSPYELISKSIQKESVSEPNQNITVNELLYKYTKALDSTSSFISDYEKTSEGSFRGGGQSGAGKCSSRGQLRYGEQGLYEYEYRWGDWASLTFTEDKPHYTISVVNSEMNYQNTKRIGDKDRPGTIIRRPRPQGQDISLHAHFGVSYLGGYIGSDERLDSILRKADRIEVQKATQKVGDSECFVIKADTKNGRYEVWLDPEHGFHPAKLLHEASEGDYSDRHLMAKGESATEYLKNVRFEKVGDVWIPVEADSGSDLRGAQGDFTKDNYHYKRTNIVLNPDHNKLGSFDDPLENPSNDPELTNGTRVLLNYLSTEYTWQGGKIVDSSGHEVDLDNLGPLSLVGKALPDVVQFNVRLNPDAIKDKMLLVCFWDMEQRPSRNAVQTLNKRAQTLLEKNNVYMTFIHAGPVEEKTLVSWLKQNQIQPPVGVSRTALPELGYNWAVQSLPWPILTDTNHIVVAEGFAIDELDEKIRGIK